MTEGTRKVYVQSAFRIADNEKREQEVASFRAAVALSLSPRTIKSRILFLRAFTRFWK